MICIPLLFEMLHDTFGRLYDKCGYIKIFQRNVKLLYKLCVQLFVCFGVTQSLLMYVSANQFISYCKINTDYTYNNAYYFYFLMVC